jgi:hypothetical protein
VEASVRVEKAALLLSEIIPRQRWNNRARINAHLDTLGILVPCTESTDKVFVAGLIMLNFEFKQFSNHLKKIVS